MSGPFYTRGARRAVAAKVAATIGDQINPGLYGSRLCSAARATEGTWWAMGTPRPRPTDHSSDSKEK